MDSVDSSAKSGGSPPVDSFPNTYSHAKAFKRLSSLSLPPSLPHALLSLQICLRTLRSEARIAESFSSICGSSTARPKSKSTVTFSVEPFAESFTDLKDIAVPFAPRHLSARESARNNVGGGLVCVWSVVGVSSRASPPPSSHRLRC